MATTLEQAEGQRAPDAIFDGYGAPSQPASCRCDRLFARPLPGQGSEIVDACSADGASHRRAQRL